VYREEEYELKDVSFRIDENESRSVKICFKQREWVAIARQILPRIRDLSTRLISLIRKEKIKKSNEDEIVSVCVCVCLVCMESTFLL
jgi:hypothetical protein